MIQLSQSLQDAYPVHESGVTFHAFHPQFIRTPMTRVLDEGKLDKNRTCEQVNFKNLKCFMNKMCVRNIITLSHDACARSMHAAAWEKGVKD